MRNSVFPILYDIISVVIQDNGIAEDIEFARKPGMGLSGMRERVAVLGGILELKIDDPGGLVIHIEIPLIESPVT